MIIKRYYNDVSFPIAKYTNFIHSVFKERIEQGIYFNCANFSTETFRKKLKNAHVIVIFDDNQDIIGTVTLTVFHHKGFTYGWHEYLAISPHFRGKNVGKLLEDEVVDIAQSENLPFILSDTANLATSSIKFHKKQGFKKILLRNYKSTNYISIVFVKFIYYSFSSLILSLLRYPLLFVTSLQYYRLKT